jgi:hypothetical protein
MDNFGAATWTGGDPDLGRACHCPYSARIKRRLHALH